MKDIVLFGVTGDLAKKKIIPALARISTYKKIRIIGFGRKKMTQKQFAEYIELAATEAGYSFKNAIDGFSTVYICSELDDITGYAALSKKVRNGAIIYMALPPAMQLHISKLLIFSGIVTKEKATQIAFEKPFGSNSTEAKKLNTYLASHLRDDQILRVDHYAGKETLLDLESSGRTGIFSFLSSMTKIKELHINFKEKITANMRGSFYDAVGALSDVAQNHMLYMLTMYLAAYAEQCIYASETGNTCTISSTTTTSVRTIRSILAESLEVCGKPVLGQYTGFREVEGVRNTSTTETYFKFELKIKPKAVKKLPVEIRESVQRIYTVFKNTKIIFEGGKGLQENDVSIETICDGRYKLMINRNCGKDAYDEIFTALIEGNLNRFVTFEQVQSGWNIIESVKEKHKGNIVEYSVGTEPRA